MDEDENTFPMDIIDRDPSFRPWEFRPQGYLVVILADTEEAQRAETALVEKGFRPTRHEALHRRAEPTWQR